MDPNLVSATLSDQDQQAIKDALNSVLQKMPFLIDLTTTDRIALAKLGDKSEAFVRKAIEVAQQHQDMFAQAFLDEMQKDANLLDTLGPIRVAVDALQKKIEDTTMQVGAEAYAAARTVYSMTKTSFGKAVMRKASEDLAKRYGRTKQAKAAAASSDTNGKTPAAGTTPQSTPSSQNA